MNTYKRVVEYVLIIVTALILGTLAGWYVFLHAKQTATSAVDTARGLDVPTPDFGTSPAGDAAANASAAQAQTSTPWNSSATSSAQLWEVEKSPVAGFGFVTSSSTVQLVYVARSNGFIVSADLNARSTSRLLADLTPKVYGAYIASDGSIIERTIRDDGSVATFSGSLTGMPGTRSEGTTTVLVGKDLSDQMRRISVDPASKTLLYSIDGTTSEDIYTSSWSGSHAIKVFSGLIRNWDLINMHDKRQIIVEAPADGVMGHAYQVGQNGSLTPLFAAQGLSLLPVSGAQAYLWSTSSGDSVSLFAKSSQNATTTTLSINTIADKCVWLSGKSLIAYCAVPAVIPSDFLDGWYQGTIHTNDSWWTVDAVSGSVGKISVLDAPQQALDVYEPQIDPSGNYIAFINKADLSLWVLRIAR